jgi:pentatricopeptide repeat protein
LFIIWSKFQSGAEGSSGYPGPTKNVCSRGKILSRRKLVDPEDKPTTLANLCMKNQEQAPELFVGGNRPGRGGGGGRDRERKPRGDRDREKGGEEGGEKGERREKREKKAEKENVEESKGEAPAAPAPSASEKKMHLESLLNYVAFNRRPQQRVLLPEEGVSPPPPPKRLRPGLQPDGNAEISGAAAEQANAEAQMVLRGAVAFKTATVAKDLYEHLMDKQVEITERTFTLMIEGCVLAGDLKSASDFLMKMETSGYCPESDLLDKVMDLYSQQKSQRQKQAEAPKEQAPTMVDAPAPEPGVPGGAAAEGDAEKPVAQSDATPMEEDLAKSSSLRSRLKLSSDAPVFVPSFMPAPPAPPAADAPAGDQQDEGEARTSLRTRLVASAKPFEPQFNVTFDPTMYTWTVDNTEEGGGGDGQGKDGKGGGKGEELPGGKKKGKTGDGKEGKGKGKESKSGGKEGKGKEGKESKSGGKAKKGTGKDDAAEKDGPAKNGGPRWKPKESKE